MKRFKKQNYTKLKRDCVNRKCLYQDVEFPADSSSLRLKPGDVPTTSVVWKRPTEICSNPKLVVNRLNSGNITQGSLGNCWFVAACCALSRVESLWNKVVPDRPEQDWGEGGSSGHGIFHFRLWLFGRWTDIVIDDRLPTASNGRLLFAHSQVANEFWCPLLEKAYAKIFGSYAALESGNLVDALVDFTAGFAERLDLLAENVGGREVERLELFAHLDDAMQRQQALVCCAIKARTVAEMEQRTDTGLVKGHAYCVTGVRSVNLSRTSGLLQIFQNRQTKLNMIRMRNPWGEKEWNGAFSDSSVEWSKVSAGERKKLGLTYEDDGEFWMTFEDFCHHFTDLSICYLLNTSLLSVRKTWHESCRFGRWSEGPRLSRTDRCGGCSNHLDTFLRNPQYRFEVNRDREKLLVMLQQEDVRGARTQNDRLLSIGFAILKVEVNRKYRVHVTKRVVSSSDYGETRNIFHKCHLDQGLYVLIPTTFLPRHSGNFLLRIFAGTDIGLRELMFEAPKPRRLLCIAKNYHLVASIKIREGRDIRVPGSTELCSCYCILQCGKRRIRSPTVRNSTSPQWNTEGIFYFQEGQRAVAKLQVWDSCLVKDRLVGQAEIDIEESNNIRSSPPRTTSWTVPLRAVTVAPGQSPGGGSSTSSSCGRVTIDVVASTSMTAI